MKARFSSSGQYLQENCYTPGEKIVYTFSQDLNFIKHTYHLIEQVIDFIMSKILFNMSYKIHTTHYSLQTILKAYIAYRVSRCI